MATPTKEEWSRAFARQAKADFEAWNALHFKPPEGASPLPQCQKLHFLQMACEKLSKAHLFLGGSKLEDLESSHTYAAKQLGIIIRHQISVTPNPPKNEKYLLAHCIPLAREIELLSPAVNDGGRRPDNCEYPWEEGGQVRVPAAWTFTALNLLLAPAGPSLLKLIYSAILRLAA